MASKQKIAFITGITGQDGSFLAKLLLEKGYRVVGGARRTASGSNWRLQELDILDKVEIVDFELTDEQNIIRVIQSLQPDEFYNLAAMSFVAASFSSPVSTLDMDGRSVAIILEALRNFSPKTRFYQASTSEMFGKVLQVPQTEATPFNPQSPYATAKAYAHYQTELYARAYNLHASAGILFNHESELRGGEFVTQKVIKHVAAVKNGATDKALELGNVYATRDWGYAPDYVEGMWRIVQHDQPGTYVLATGEQHSVKELVEVSFAHIGITLEWSGTGLQEVAKDAKTGKVMVSINEKFYRPAEVESLIGDSSKAEADLGWKPSTTFALLVQKMMEFQLRS